MADYKQEIAAQETMEWVTAAGRKLSVTVTLSRMLIDYFGDGAWSPEAGYGGTWTVNLESSIDGKAQGSDWVHDLQKAQGDVVAYIGKIGLKADRKAEIEALTARVKSAPQYVEQLAARDRAEKLDQEYQQHVRKVNGMMTLNGGSY